MDIIKLKVASFNGNAKNDIEYAFNVDDISEPIRIATDPVTDSLKALLPVYSGGYKRISPNSYPLNTSFYISETLQDIDNLSPRLITLTIKEEDGRVLETPDQRVFDCNKITGQLSPEAGGADTKIFYITGNIVNNIEYIVDETIDDILANIPDSGGASQEAIFVNQEEGDDATGDGSKQNPFKTAIKGLQSTKLLGIPRVVLQATTAPYLIDKILWSDNTGDNEIIDGAILDSEGVVSLTTLSWDDPNNFDDNFSSSMFNIDEDKHFEIHGQFIPIGDGGSFAVDSANAVVRAIFSEYNQERGGLNGFVMRPKNGRLEVSVLNGDVSFPDRPGMFVGPGNGSVSLTVQNGDMTFPKDFFGFTSNQTRGAQIISSNPQKIEFRANNFRLQSSPDLSLTECMDLFYIDAPGADIEIHGNLIEDTEPSDGVFFKSSGNDGMIVVRECKSVKFYGNIESKATSCIQLDDNVTGDIEIHGNIHCERKCAINDVSSSASCTLKIFGKTSSNGEMPTILRNSNAKIHYYGPIENKNTSKNAIGIANDGGDNIFHNGSDIKLAQTAPAYPMATRTAGRTYKLQADILTNITGFSPAPKGRVETWTPQYLRPNRDYKVNVDGAVFTVDSAALSLNAMVTAMVAAIGSPAGVASVVDNTGSLTVTWSVATNGSMTDVTTWFTQVDWHLTSSKLSDTQAGLTVNGEVFNQVFPGNGAETVWALPDLDTAILTPLQAAIDANGVVGPITTTTKGSVKINIADDGVVGLDVVPSGVSLIVDIDPVGIVTVDDYGMVAAQVDDTGVYAAVVNASLEV